MLPLAVPEEVVRDTMATTAALQDAVVRLHDLIDLEPDLRSVLMASLDPGSARCAEIQVREPPGGRRRWMRRPDGHITPDGTYAIMEVNQVAPQGQHFDDADQRAAKIIFGELGRDYEPVMLFPRIAEWLISEHRTSTGSDVRRVAIVSELGHPLSRRYRAATDLLNEAFDGEVDVVECYPTELTRSGDGAQLRGEPVDIVWLNYLDMSFFDKKGISESVFYEVLAAAHRTTVLNPPAALLTGSKTALALLRDDGIRRRLGLPPKTERTLLDHLPETVDLSLAPHRRDEIVTERERWISKPSDVCAGQGIVLGPRVDDDRWRAVVDARSSPGFVFQRFVPPSTGQAVELTDDGRVRLQSLEFVLSPHVIGGEVTGAATVRGHEADGSPTRPIAVGSGFHFMPMLQRAP